MNISGTSTMSFQRLTIAALVGMAMLVASPPALALPTDNAQTTTADVNELIEGAKVPKSAKMTAGLTYAGDSFSRLVPFNLNLHGTYETHAKDALPEFGMTFRLTANQTSSAGGVTYTGGHFYVRKADLFYVANQTRTDKITSLLTKLLQSSNVQATFGAIPLDLLENPQIIRTASRQGLTVYEIRGVVNLDKVFASLRDVLAKARAVMPTKAPGKVLKKVEDRINTLDAALGNPTMDLSIGVNENKPNADGSPNYILLSRVVVGQVVDPANAANTGKFVLQTTFARVNKEQNIFQPQEPLPLSSILQ